MTRDPRDIPAAGGLRDQYGRIQYLVTAPNDALSAGDVLTPSGPFDADGREHIALIGVVGGGGGGAVSDASTATKGVTRLSVAPASPTAPIALGANDPIVATVASHESRLAIVETELVAVSGDSTFGNDVVGGTLQTLTGNTKMVGRMVATATGQVPYLEIWLDGNGGSAGPQNVKAVLFLDDGSATNPGALLAQSAQLNLVAGAAGTWVRFPLLTIPTITVGQTLWGGWHAGTQGGTGRYAVGPAGALRYNADVLTDGTTDPFGTPTSVGQTLSVRGVVQNNTALQIAALQADVDALAATDTAYDVRLDALEAGGAGGATTAPSADTAPLANFPLPASATFTSDPIPMGGKLLSVAGIADQAIGSLILYDSSDGVTKRARAVPSPATQGGNSIVNATVPIVRPYAHIALTNGATDQGSLELARTIA